MEKKTQIYLSALIMAAITGFAGYINQFSSYWVVFILSALFAALSLVTIFTDEELKQETKFDWLTISAFFGVQTILTFLVAILKLPFVGFFKYLNYGIQVIGLALLVYYVVNCVVKSTKIIDLVKEKLASRNKSNNAKVVNSEVATKVEDAIKEETVLQENNDNSDVEIVGQTNKEPEVLGIEYRQEKEIETPYMEEEI